jgi:hypothetical protein
MQVAVTQQISRGTALRFALARFTERCDQIRLKL